MGRTTRRVSTLVAWVVLLNAAPPFVAPGSGQTASLGTPQGLLDAWVDLWGTYDLDRVSSLFLQDDRLTYFSSETEGLIRGFEAIVEHHRGFGFESGGSDRDQVIWVDEVQIVGFGETAFIGAIWYFGSPEAPEGAQRGPMSVLAVREGGQYRIAHMNFASYEGES